jgi:hypothetical protein
MNRVVRLESSRSPDDIFKALARQGQQWRESAVPATLRPRIAGLGVRVEPPAFWLHWEHLGRDGVPPICKGRIVPTGSGALVEAAIVTPLRGVAVVGTLAVTVILVGLFWAKLPLLESLIPGIGFGCIFAAVQFAVSGRHLAEAEEFEAALRSAAGIANQCSANTAP